MIAVFLLLFVTGCRSLQPWRDEPGATEVNLSVVFEKNLLYLSSITLNNQKGRFLFGTSHVRSVLDPDFRTTLGGPRLYAVQLSEKESIRISPVLLDLGEVGDGIIGADVFGKSAVSVDYKSGLVTYQKEGIHPEGMVLFQYGAEPAIELNVDGRIVRAIVDTASPDTLVLPGNEGRGMARVAVAGTDFGSIDVKHAPVAEARVGNRILSRFLLSIDYRKRIVGLWRDPRIPL
ncbi:MAG TPA: hypothetical protein VFL80_08710 [Thermoanaerobaculia bacterium]|nr:hypothetical protein [Thermoanaerobaculia bacterium]